MNGSDVNVLVGAIRITFEPVFMPRIDYFSSILSSLVDLISICTGDLMAEEERLMKEGRMPAHAMDLIRSNAISKTQIYSLQYSSPLEVVLAISVGATALITVINQMIGTRKNLAESDAVVAKSRVSRLAYAILENHLKNVASSKDFTSLDIYSKEILQNAAAALAEIEDAEKLN